MHSSLTRFQAFAAHLLISSLILGVFLALTLFVWYPQPFLTTEGLLPIIQLLIAVDIVLGPSLTLLIFKAGKPGLKRDLTIIFAIQIAGFAYGANTIYTERPYFALFSDSDYFDVIPASSVTGLSNLPPELADSAGFSPLFVYVTPPKDIETLRVILEEMKAGKPEIKSRPEYYHPLKGHIHKSFELSKDLDTLQKVPANMAEIEQFKKQYRGNIDDFAFFTISGKATSRLLVINRETENIVDYININPRAR